MIFNTLDNPRYFGMIWRDLWAFPSANNTKAGWFLHRYGRYGAFYGLFLQYEKTSRSSHHFLHIPDFVR
ncbi:hypothetical protein M427DRAFT_58949 [Gonapodya prolifera JEL478]|uniref:Uncharacterized protein n=1 Tax=Gonapodya prolifera (strain JEL478) TaxID=1344416 RepID=A0A139A8C0_GONPJ|nr:hypothetical protein M427DRAFT_58949 [Gonapodya prolifera JEL478]|eukprot:KXS13030.1 hypothetical protein M427DRAFT_58949 [Gonapodya prolifera JEL478]